MNIIFGLLGIVGSFFLVVKREAIGDMFGEAEWMQKVGGVYNVMIICAIFLFFWSIAFMTGTMDVLFSPITNFFRPRPI
ncbi:MAG: hypothetical protein KBD00_03870 [Candidatus Peribacteraceae bacterium]|nr:hypothetical protein [Candidatus Peribacteraceae bacterium]